MRIEDLEAGLDRYGGDLARWPERLRTEAEALAARDVGAAARIAVAARLDSALAETMRAQRLDSALIGRIAAATEGRVSHDVALRPTPRLAAWACGAVMLFLTTGYVAGLALPTTSGGDVFAGLMFGSSGISLDTDIDADTGSLL